MGFKPKSQIRKHTIIGLVAKSQLEVRGVPIEHSVTSITAFCAHIRKEMEHPDNFLEFCREIWELESPVKRRDRRKELGGFNGQSL